MAAREKRDLRALWLAFFESHIAPVATKPYDPKTFALLKAAFVAGYGQGYDQARTRITEALDQQAIESAAVVKTCQSELG
jgi:hypothetical protein